MLSWYLLLPKQTGIHHITFSRKDIVDGLRRREDFPECFSMDATEEIQKYGMYYIQLT